MSYILDALRKVERERQQPEVPGISLARAPERSSRNRWIILLLVILVLINLTWFAYNLFTKQAIESETTPAKQISKIDSAKSSSVLQSGNNKPDSEELASLLPPGKTTVPKRPAHVPQSIDDLMASHQQHQQTDPTTPEESKQTPIIKSRAKKQAPNNTTTGTLKPQQASINSAPTRAEVNSRQTLKPEKSKQKTARKKPHNKPAPKIKQTAGQGAKKPRNLKRIPTLQQLSPDFKDQLPQLKINVYVYAENADNAFVIINMRKFRIGDYIEQDLKLVDIGVDSIILSKAGRQFRVARP